MFQGLGLRVQGPWSLLSERSSENQALAFAASVAESCPSSFELAQQPVAQTPAPS